MLRFILIPVVLILLLHSCKSDSRYSYAIKDFRKPLQSHLQKIVCEGLVRFRDTILSQQATDKELKQLTESEHPVLRAAAFREIQQRKTFNQFDLLMSHLDDTAVVATDAGEFGIAFRTVSDDIIVNAKWKNKAEKMKTVDAVITNHNYLQSASTILITLEPEEKYYAFIREMATRKIDFHVEIGKRGFDEIEYALYGLAKFKKKEDIKIIREQLLENSFSMTGQSFQLMSEFPDTSYLQVFEKYYPRQFYRSICREPEMMLAGQFINSLAIYKNQRSAAILDSMLNKRQLLDCQNAKYFEDNVVSAIGDNDCPAYSKLRKKVEQRLKEIEKNTIRLLPSNPAEYEIFRSEGDIRW